MTSTTSKRWILIVPLVLLCGLILLLQLQPEAPSIDPALRAQTERAWNKGSYLQPEQREALRYPLENLQDLSTSVDDPEDGLAERGREDISFLSITMDPEIDTPEVLAKYAKDMRIESGWTFLTGNYGEIDDLRRSLGIYDPDPIVDADKTQHAGLITFGKQIPSQVGTPSHSGARNSL